MLSKNKTYTVEVGYDDDMNDMIPSSKDVHRTQSCRSLHQNLINILPCCTKLSVANCV